jgi:sirohydrochlorin cobaltochelatase
MGKAVVLFGHGSRDPLWRLPMESVAARMQALQPQLPVRCAFLELDAPTLPQAAAELVAAGAAHLTVVPMFLGAGRHAREDLPALVDQLRASHPGVVFVLQKPVGEDARVLDLLARIALE